jgi:hypothetical protein
VPQTGKQLYYTKELDDAIESSIENMDEKSVDFKPIGIAEKRESLINREKRDNASEGGFNLSISEMEKNDRSQAQVS